jgi:menaquinone-specific isochorismate synthase
VTTAPVATAPRVRTRAIDAGALLDHLPAESPLAWVRDGDGLVGWGVAARVEVSGPDRFAAAQRWWDALVAQCDVDDELDVPGSGPVAFGSFAFGDDPGSSTLVVPKVVLGRRDGRAWVTTMGDAGPLAAAAPPRRPRGVRWAEGSSPVMSYRAAVASAVDRIRAGDVAKVVLAYDLLASTDEPVDVRWLLHRLAERYPGCWVFSVDGLAGATPELLVRREGTRVSSRVLAGTVRRTADTADDAAAAAALLGSHKDREEHDYAVTSLVETLRPHCASLDLPAGPTVLTLSNVMHLATDVDARLADGSTALDLAGAVHPTAAVGGTPTPDAVALIAELEGMDRGRYAGPVGWVDSRGDGEWGIALRCAEVGGRTVRLFAGCGIVAESEPDAEVAEAQAKFLPVRDALEG